LKYQKYISPFFGKKCRYYPTCSSYALVQFQKDGFFMALFKTLKRVLSCNHFFLGGIDYPTVKKDFSKVTFKKIDVDYWYIASSKTGIYYVVKSLGEN
jgi:putative membrane protein insertion efficiency factor